MKLGNFKIIIFVFILFLIGTLSVFSADKIESVPLINLEDLSPTFEEDKDELEKIDEKNTNLNENEDLRILSYKILLEKFNKKYSKLDVKQKSLLKEYINNISNTNSLKEYIQKEIKYVRKELKSNKKNIKDKITKIKLNEAANSINKFCNIGSKKIVKDKAVVQLIRYYELIKELRKHA